jgi:hypothetical protein
MTSASNVRTASTASATKKKPKRGRPNKKVEVGWFLVVLWLHISSCWGILWLSVTNCYNTSMGRGIMLGDIGFVLGALGIAGLMALLWVSWYLLEKEDGR